MHSDHPNPDHQVLAIVRNVLPADLVRIRLEQDTDIRMDILTPPFTDDALAAYLDGKVLVYAEYLPHRADPAALIKRALAQSRAPVMAVGENLGPDILDDLAEMGVAGCADRAIPADLVVPTIRAIVEGHYTLLSRATRRKPCRHGLVDDECHIMRMIAAGLTDKDIADRVGKDFHVLRKDIQRIYAKLDVRTRTQAALAVSGCACLRGVMDAA